MRPWRNSWSFVLCGFAMLLVSAALRFFGARGDLWLDEIWTLDIVSNLEHGYRVLWGPYLDNNHFLNTYYIYLVGTQSSPSVLRALAVVTGTASVALAGLIGLRRGRPEALINMLVLGLSYAMVHYASEARGYGPMIFFFLLGFYLLEAELCTPRKSYRYLFAVAVVLGFLSHPIYVTAIASFVFWFFFDRLRSSRSVLRAVDASVGFFLPTLVLFSALLFSLLFAIAKEGMNLGGGTWSGGSKLIGYAIRLGRLLLFEFGIPLSVSPLLVVVAFLVFAASTIAILLWRGDSRAWFYLVTILLVPAVMLVSTTPIHFDTRHFMLTGVAVLLLTGQCLAWVVRTNLTTRVLAGVILALFAFGNTAHLTSFLESGRGNYGSAVRLMEQQRTGQIITVGGDHRFRTPMLLNYYSAGSIDDGRIHYIEKEHWGDCSPQWLIVRGNASAFDPPLTLSIKPSVRRDGPKPYDDACSSPADAAQDTVELEYELNGVYRYWGLSGWHWALYRRT